MASYQSEIAHIESTGPIEKKIINAFMTLYEHHQLNKINIKMITDLADLNQGTFYLHYQDIYDLLDTIESQFHHLSKAIARNTVNALFNHDALVNALPEIEFYESNLKHLKILLCINGKSNLEQVMKREIKEAITRNFCETAFQDDELNEYALEYIASALVATIIHWIRNDMRIPLNQVSRLLQNFASNGALDFFAQFEKSRLYENPLKI